jgi:hypothetical protein
MVLGFTDTLVTSIRAAGRTIIATVHAATDHTRDGHRIALQAANITWLRKLSGPKLA